MNSGIIQPSQQQQLDQTAKLRKLKEQLEQGRDPFQAMIDASQQFQLTLSDAQLFRVELIREIESITGRPLIVYEASLSKGAEIGANMLVDEDKIAFSGLIERIDEKSVDILIQSPGGKAEFVEQVVNMLRARFDDIRFIIPDVAKSAATMLALSGDRLVMDERSELGPIDPQVHISTPSGVMFVPAHTIIKGFEEAKKEIEQHPALLPAYIPMLSKYDLHIFEICRTATELSKTLVSQWLEKYMFRNRKDAKKQAVRVAEALCSYESLLSHARAIGIEMCEKLQLEIDNMKCQPQLQRKIWELHCAYSFHLANTTAVKIYENSRGTAWHRQLAQIAFPFPPVLQQRRIPESPKTQQ